MAIPSETFAFEAVAARGDDPRPYHVYYFGDFDRSGYDAARSLNEKLQRFARELPKCRCEIVFDQVAITADQIGSLIFQHAHTSASSPADRAWPRDFACELDAMPPDTLRALVRNCIKPHLPQHQLKS